MQNDQHAHMQIDTLMKVWSINLYRETNSWELASSHESRASPKPWSSHVHIWKEHVFIM
jgi:hypothetical protein